MEPTKPKPNPVQVYKLMEEYTRLDYLMAETLLMQTEEELERYLAVPTSESQHSSENNVAQ